MTTHQAKKNVALLAGCQALAMTGNTILLTIGALIAATLVEDKSLATLPLAIQQAATMVATIPASLLMKRIGRRYGFMFGTLVGMMGASLGAYAVFAGSFPLFCLATLLFGVFNGFNSFYRFAAAEVATEEFRSQAISLVIAGGIVAALIGPGLATWSKDWLLMEFAGGLVVVIALQLLAIGLLAGVAIPPLQSFGSLERGRGLVAIAQQPTFIVAVLGSMLGYGVMLLVMTATPLAMVAHQHDFSHAASVIQWHVLGMFVPSLFTGFLIARLGVLNIISVGILLNIGCFAVNLMGTTVANFAVGLLFLGIGWNFMYIGSTTLLTEAYTPPEKAKTQAMHDFLMYAFVTFATFLSGELLNDWGWQMVNYVGALMIAIALTATLWLRWQRSKSVAERLS
jgi:MFS family permease